MHSTVSDEQEIERLERELASALVSGDIAALERLYADELVFGHATGKIDSKASWLSRLRTDLKYELFDTSDLRVRVFGNTAVSIGNTHAVNTRAESNQRFTRVYMKSGRHWRIVAHNAGALVPVMWKMRGERLDPIRSSGMP